MQKVYGSPKRQDGLYQIGRNKYELIYGFGKDHESDETGWNWRQTFNHLPSAQEIRNIIEEQINAITAERILKDFSWNGKPVWLSTENQINIKTAYDIARDTDGENLPLRFKLGETPESEPVYHTFTKADTFGDFVKKMAAHIQKAISDGYTEKDSVDYTKFNLQ